MELVLFDKFLCGNVYYLGCKVMLSIIIVEHKHKLGGPWENQKVLLPLTPCMICFVLLFWLKVKFLRFMHNSGMAMVLRHFNVTFLSRVSASLPGVFNKTWPTYF